MGGRIRLLASLVALALASGASAQQMQIGFAEPVDIPAVTGAVSIEAHGLRFDLSLEANERLIGGMSVARKAALSNVRLLRGRVNGRPDTWVRLMRVGDYVSGAFWDGSDLYMIARHGEIAAYLSNPLAAPPEQTVVYRLSDTLNLLPPNFCATGAPVAVAPVDGLTQFKSLVDELKLTFTAVPTDALDISLLADSYLTRQYATSSPPSNDVRIAMLDTLNIVDGIYDAQLGLMLTASELHTVPEGSDTLMSDSASTLLDQLQTYRSTVPALQSKPLSHLFSSRVLEQGTVLGIARIGGACSSTDGISLTAVGLAGIGSQHAFVMAHEIAHNLDATHDTAACGDTFLMWPEYSHRIQGRFSQCSLDQMRPFIAQHRGTCITPAQYADVEARVGAIAEPLRTEPFTWPVFVRSAGNALVNNAVVDIDLSREDFDSVTTTHGYCTLQGRRVRCELGTLAAGVEARVDLQVTPGSLGELDLTARADAANDRYETNDVATGRTTVQPPATLSIGVTPATTDVFVGDVVPITFTISASGQRTSRAVTLSLGGSYVDIVSTSPTQGTCGTIACTLGDLPSGSSVQVTANVRAVQGGQLGFGAQMSSANAWTSRADASVTLNATATLDLALAPQPPMRIVAVGVPFDIVVPVRANGTRAVIGGLFRMNLTARFISADVDGVPCAVATLMSAYGGGCPLGTLNPGDTRTVTVRAQFDAPQRTNVTMMAEIPIDELASNNQATVLYDARHATDVSLYMFPDGFGMTEGIEFDVAVNLRSQGAQDATDVTTTLDVPQGLRIVSATLPQGTCTASGPRRISCVRAVVGSESQLTARLVGEAPALYQPVWTIQAANDGAPDNNTRSFVVNIFPLADVGINPLPQMHGFIVGQPKDLEVEVVTGSLRPVENVVVTFPASDALIVESMQTPVGTCATTGFSPRCSLGTLPPNSLVRVSARYRALRSGSGIGGSIRVDALRDVNYDNNTRSVTLNTYEAGDVELRVGATSASGVVGGTVSLPRITLNTVSRSQDIRVQIPLPAFASVDFVSGNAACSGGSGTTLECFIYQREAGSSDSLDIAVRLNAVGSFTSNVVVRAMNDTNPSNDSASFQLTSAAAAAPPSPPASGGGSAGGGGGRSDWFVLVLLALLALARAPTFSCALCRIRDSCGLRH